MPSGWPPEDWSNLGSAEEVRDDGADEAGLFETLFGPSREFVHPPIVSTVETVYARVGSETVPSG
jgi:hypothetical protein